MISKSRNSKMAVIALAAVMLSGTMVSCGVKDKGSHTSLDPVSQALEKELQSFEYEESDGAPDVMVGGVSAAEIKSLIDTTAWAFRNMDYKTIVQCINADMWLLDWFSEYPPPERELLQYTKEFLGDALKRKNVPFYLRLASITDFNTEYIEEAPDVAAFFQKTLDGDNYNGRLEDKDKWIIDKAFFCRASEDDDKGLYVIRVNGELKVDIFLVYDWLIKESWDSVVQGEFNGDEDQAIEAIVKELEEYFKDEEY